MTWWVYEDDPTKSVRVYEATCRFCNNGLGVRGSRLIDNPWHGPFATRQETIDAALSTGRRDVRGCWFCLCGVHSFASASA